MIRRRRLRRDRPCPFCGSEMQYAESGRYAEWTCTGDRPVVGPNGQDTRPCEGHAKIPLKWQHSQ